ncbi:MAG: DUF1648 domain-containing protein [Clostridiaceae bacterium]|nr:DUF1648 domain-containing protein [Clostridiaceae bacterium]MBW4858501.1 DUF1648 domain-containing protein [Clostridiaceae bacterium]MBW4867749.1 DUF1648 domain-containing protein [Clostridiaceae bacterium]MBW4868061.1 DUF1648 domain-containing protein [Clostridiaceae bacterium]
MEDKIYIVIMNLFIYVVLLIMQILTPKMTRKNIYFGIRIPEEELNNEELKKIYKTYIIENILISIPSIALLSYWTYNSNSPIVVTLTIFIYIGILFLVYLHGNNKIKKLKEEKEWKGFKDEVVVDLKFSKNRASAASISSWWFLIPVGIALINLIVGLNISSNLPERIPTNWDFQGNITGYMDKNFFIWFMPLVQLGMAGTMFFVCKIIGWSKQEISAKNPKESVKRNIIFRRIWSIYILVTNIVLNILFTLASFYSFGIIGGSINIIMVLFFIFTGLIILSSIIISIKVGQGGSRLEFDEHYEERNRDDDRFWKLGNSIYYNPEDPALFIEKRFGVGWTVNVGRPLGIFLMIIPLIIIVFTLLLVS